MKRNHLFVHCIAILCILSLCFTACTDTEPQPVVTTEYHTITDAPPDSVTTTSTLTETETAEDTSQVSSEPYDLRHTIHDFSSQLPSYIPKNLNDYPRTLTVDENGLHLYVSQRQTAQANIYTFHPDSAEVTVLPVPKIEDQFPIFAYSLSDGRFLMAVKKNKTDYTGYSLFITEQDGTVTAECEFGDTYTPDGYVISEEENGDIIVLMGSGQYLYLYYYNAAASTFTRECRYEQSLSTCVGINAIRYIGNFTYYGANVHGTMTLDMKDGTVKPYTLRIPEERGDLKAHIGADQKIYLSDTEGLYLYSDDIPTKVLNWVDCNIQMQDYHMWIVNDHTFFFLKFDAVNGNTLQCVTTERIPYTDSRSVIHITGFESLQDEWLTNAVFKFNQTNENYRVALNYVNTHDREQEDINADIAELMLYSDHPDILIHKPTAWRPLDIYYEKNIFVNLMPYFGDDLLTCAAEGITYNGALYTLPTTMELETFVCADTVTDTTLTWETFYSIMDSVSVPDSILTSDPNTIDYIYENGIMDFCDLTWAESYYDTDEFRDMLIYHQKMEGMIDNAVGIIKRAIDTSYGYTRAALPAYLREGRIKFLNVPISKLNDILAPMLLYGDTDFTWCGYPSRDGGGAQVSYSGNMFSVFADTDVLDGCIEFLSYLLSVEWQCQPTLTYLPVTESGLRVLMENSRYWYYQTEIYEKYDDPNAELVPAPFYGSLSSLKYIPTRAGGSSADWIEDWGQISEDTEYEEEWMKPAPVGYVTVELTDEYAEAFIDFLNSCHMKANVDNTLKSIVTEEISYWKNNARSLKETTKIIDSRVWIYLNE